MRAGRAKGPHRFRRWHACDLCVLTKEWRKKGKIKTRTCFSAVLTPAPTSLPHKKKERKKKRWFHTKLSIVSCSCWPKRHFLSQIKPRITRTPCLKATCMSLREKNSHMSRTLCCALRHNFSHHLRFNWKKKSTLTTWKENAQRQTPAQLPLITSDFRKW